MTRILVCLLLAALPAGGPAAGSPSAAPAIAPGVTASAPGVTASAPGATAAVPGATAAVPGATAAVPGATAAVPGATAAVPDGPGDEPAPPAGRFGWPLPGVPTVVRAFEPPPHRFGPGHRGVDLAAAAGTPVRAAGAGTVVFAGPVAGRGVVSIDHPGGLRTTYEPVAPSVAAGDVVLRGQQIGTVQGGHPGCPDCLHWGVRRGVDYLDPLHLLGLGRLRLLPWQDSPDG